MVQKITSQRLESTIVTDNALGAPCRLGDPVRGASWNGRGIEISTSSEPSVVLRTDGL